MLIQYERKNFCDVIDCTINRNLPPPFLHVKNDTANFGSIGEFTCDNNGTLFFTNGTLVSSNYTTCLATAKWARQNQIECWEGRICTIFVIVVKLCVLL